MGGPAAGVLLPRVPNDREIRTLRTWLGENAKFYTAKSNDDLWQGWEFFLNWPTALGEEPPGGPCLGGIQIYSVDPDKDCSGASFLSPADWVRYQRVLGWMPACELEVGMNCNQPRDHKVLGWLCAELATRFDGMVDLGGTLPLPDRREWSRVGLIGSVFDVVYDIDAVRTGHVHIVDATLLRSWILQPNFHMIK